MDAAPFPTAITDLFGIRLPIVAGGLMWLANADYVAAASRAGIIGFITAASFPDPAMLRAEIRRCRELCDGGPFGVNVSMLPKLVPGDEIWAHDDYKQRLVEAQPTDTDLCMHSLRNTVRTLRNETTAAVKAMESESPQLTIKDLMPLVSGQIGRNAYVTGDWSKGLLAAGHSLAFVDRLEPLAAIVGRLESEMRVALGRVSRYTDQAATAAT